MPIVRQTLRSLCLVLMLFSGLVQPTIAQIPGLEMPHEVSLPSGVKRIGQIETTPVNFDGLPLFEIASPLVVNRDAPGDVIPVEVRARQAEADFEGVLITLSSLDQGSIDTDKTPLESGKVKIEIRSQDGAVSLTARGVGLPHARTLIAVTPQDAEHNNTSVLAVAEDWRGKLSAALSDAIRSRRPVAQHERYATAGKIAIAVVVIHGIIFGLDRLILRREDALRKEIDRHKTIPNSQQSEDIPTDSDSNKDTQKRREHHDRLRLALSLKKRFKLLAFLRWFLFWGILSVWVAGIGFTLFLFPQTRRIAIYLFATPLLVAIAFLFAGLVNRIADLLIDQSIANWQSNRLPEGEHKAHLEARIDTISQVMRVLKLIVVYSIGIFWILSRLEVVPWSLVTIGAVFALAVSLGAQSLIKDVVNGVLILFEDQYAIGDYITMQDTMGKVEYMNLRITQIRTQEGRLVTLPNSSITKVENLSRNWSRAIVDFEVAPTAKVDDVLVALRRISQEMAQEPAWKDIILESNQWSGVSKLSRAAITIEIAVQTKPLKHWSTGRELRRRIKHALETELLGANN